MVLMAVPAYPAQNGDTPGRTPPDRSPAKELKGIHLLVVKLFAGGTSMDEISEHIVREFMGGKQCSPRTRRRKMAVVKKKLRRWEQTQWFRDAVWEQTLTDSDLSLPRVMRGISRKAAQGDAAAAKLLLEVTGRHTFREGQQQAAVVNVSFGGVPRPQPAIEPLTDSRGQGDVVEGEADEIT